MLYFCYIKHVLFPSVQAVQREVRRVRGPPAPQRLRDAGTESRVSHDLLRLRRVLAGKQSAYNF